MDADIKGALEQINSSYRSFEHNGQPMRKDQVKAVLEFGLSQGYKAVSQIKDEDVNQIIKEVNSEYNSNQQYLEL